MAEQLYPVGYGSEYVSLGQLMLRHQGYMHPEYRRRVFAWIVSMNGLVGIGGGFRTSQPVKPGFAPSGKTFHMFQKFPSGDFYCALDLVVKRPGQVHGAPSWDQVATAPLYGVHCFIGKDTPDYRDDEAWHIQPIEIRGWQAWIDAGSPDLGRWVLPGSITTPKDDEMIPTSERLYDSREGKSIAARTEVSIPVGQHQTVLVNLTAVNGQGAGWMSVYSDVRPDPYSNLSVHKGGVTNAVALVAVKNGHIKVFSSVNTDFVVDLQGYT